MKKILAYVMLALIASLWGCSDMGDRDNPTDRRVPVANRNIFG